MVSYVWRPQHGGGGALLYHISVCTTIHRHGVIAVFEGDCKNASPGENIFQATCLINEDYWCDYKVEYKVCVCGGGTELNT